MPAQYDPQQTNLDLNAVHSVLTNLLAADKRKPLGHFYDMVEAAEELLNTIRDGLAQAAAPSPAPAPSADPLPPALTAEKYREDLIAALRRELTPEIVARMIAGLPESRQRVIYQEFVQPKPTRRITKIIL